MEFVRVLGWKINYLLLEIKGGNPNDSINDQVWIRPNGNIMEIYNYIDEEIANKLISLFKVSHRKAIKDVFKRFEII